MEYLSLLEFIPLPVPVPVPVWDGSTFYRSSLSSVFWYGPSTSDTLTTRFTVDHG